MIPALERARSRKMWVRFPTGIQKDLYLYIVLYFNFCLIIYISEHNLSRNTFIGGVSPKVIF